MIITHLILRFILNHKTTWQNEWTSYMNVHIDKNDNKWMVFVFFVYRLLRRYNTENP